MIFNANGTSYEIEQHLRSEIKPNWQEMLLPAKDRLGKFPKPTAFLSMLYRAEVILEKFNKTLVGKHILEVGCNEGMRCYLMARYHDTYVHGIDVDDYTVAQSPDMNLWNPNDEKFVHGMFDNKRSEISKLFPDFVAKKVSFETADISKFNSGNRFDVIISWDTIEHIVNLDSAFKNMSEFLQDDGFIYHEYNPFFSINGGHSLCTLDFPFGHCRLSREDFRRYVKEVRPEEDKIDINFYEKCLNRASWQDIRELADKYSLEILSMEGDNSFRLNPKKVEPLLIDIQKHYPKVTMDDILHDAVKILMRRKC